MKKGIAILLAAVLALSLWACAEQQKSTQTNYSNQTIYAKLLSLDDGKAVVLKGTLETLSAGPQMGGQPGGTSPAVPGGKGAPPQGNPPAKPDGDGQPPEAVSGASESQDTSSKPADSKPEAMGQSSDMTVFVASRETLKYDLSSVDCSSFKTGDVLKLTLGENETVTAASVEKVDVTTATADQGSAATTLNKDQTVKNQTYTSTSSNENALRVDGAVVTLNGVTIDKQSGETTDPGNGDFYGINAGFLATNGATVLMDKENVSTNAQGGNGVFSYGAGTTVNISNSTINTKKDNSGGLQTTGGGTMNASNVTVRTLGNSAAAIRSDRGGGFVRVTGGTFTSEGYNSPAVYSTAQIKIKNAELTAKNSEALVIEGKNSIALNGANVSGNMSKTRSSSKDVNVHNVMIYQSMSGDAEEGLAKLSMKDGTLVGESGDMFFITNTAAQISLTNVAIRNNDASGNLFTITGNNAKNGWGTAGKNGAQATITCSDQDLNGSIVVDTISTMNLTLKDNSTLTGTINIVDNEAGGAAVSNNAVVTIGKGCTWKLTGNCKITSLTNLGKIDFNGYTITLADGTVLSK